jgi:hypothetical protein
LSSTIEKPYKSRELSPVAFDMIGPAPGSASQPATARAASAVAPSAKPFNAFDRDCFKRVTLLTPSRIALLNLSCQAFLNKTTRRGRHFARPDI